MIITVIEARRKRKLYLLDLLSLLLLARLLRAILLTVHGDRLLSQAGKEKACSRFHVGNRLLVRHKVRNRRHKGLLGKDQSEVCRFFGKAFVKGVAHNLI